MRGIGSYKLPWGPPKPTSLEVSMVNNLVLRWPKPLFFMVLGARGRWWFLTYFFVVVQPDFVEK